MSLKAGPLGASGGSEKALSIGVILLVVTAIIVVFVVLNKFFKFGGKIGDAVDGAAEAVGLKDTAADKANKAKLEAEKLKSATTTSPWNPAYYKNLTGSYTLITRASADAICKNIYDSVGWFVTYPNEGLAAIKQCKNKAQVSWVADVFYLNYQSDLFTWMKESYHTSEGLSVMTQITDYVNSLPAK